jgi:hypothetical protein
VSCLATRLRRLEQRAAFCSTCAKHPCRIEVVGPTGVRYPPESERDEPCPDCRRIPELITAVLSFDPRPADLDEDEGHLKEAP